jgi:hypothetical protein
MPSLWTFDEFDAHEPERALHLSKGPPWPELVEAVLEKLRSAIETKNARFGLDESALAPVTFVGWFSFHLGPPLFDWLFNSTTGYRAQFRIGRANGLAMNAQLIGELAAELERFAATDIVIHKYTSEFTYKESIQGKVTRVGATLDAKLSKVWVCDELICKTGQIENLCVSPTGPKLLMPNTDPWSSLYPEDADGWLDVKVLFSRQRGSRTSQSHPRKEPRSQRSEGAHSQVIR